MRAGIGTRKGTSVKVTATLIRKDGTRENIPVNDDWTVEFTPHPWWKRIWFTFSKKLRPTHKE
jgi:hypothetical protein